VVRASSVRRWSRALLGEGYRVRVLDDLSSGSLTTCRWSADLVIGDAADVSVADGAVIGADVVVHEAAHRAVLKSVEDPLPTDTAKCSRNRGGAPCGPQCRVRRVVYDSSSSVYAGSDVLPTRLNARTIPRSPYAVSKLAAEQYCRVHRAPGAGG